MSYVRLLLAVVLLVSVTSSQLVAQDPSLEQGAISDLQEITGPFLAPYRADTGVCGKYFRAAGGNPDGTKAKAIALIATTPAKDGTKNYRPATFASDKVQVRVASSQKVPQLKVLHAGGPVIPWVEIILTQQELKLSPCLAHLKLAV